MRLRLPVVAVLFAIGGTLGSGETAAALTGIPTAASTLRSVATSIPEATPEKTYYVRRCFWRYGRRWCRVFWRPYRHYYYRRHYWHPYRHYYYRHYYWHPYRHYYWRPYRHYYWHRRYWW